MNVKKIIAREISGDEFAEMDLVKNRLLGLTEISEVNNQTDGGDDNYRQILSHENMIY